MYFNGIKSIENLSKNKRSGYRAISPESSAKGQISFCFSTFGFVFIHFCESVSIYLDINKLLVYLILQTIFIVFINVAISKYLSSSSLIEKYKGLYLGHKFKKEKLVAENSIFV